MKRSILCGVDLEHKSRAAENIALRLAERTNSDVQFLHVNNSLLEYQEYYGTQNSSSLPPVGEQLLNAIADDSRAQLSHHLRPLLKDNGMIRMACEFGQPDKVILNHLNQTESPMNLLVVSKRHRSFASDLYLGSVANRLVERSRVPVLLIPDDKRYLNWEPRHIVVAVPRADRPHEALQTASSLANLFSAKVTLLHVATNAPASEYEKIIHHAKQRLEKIAAELDLPPEQIQIEVRGGNTVETLNHYMIENEADLLVLGTHQQSGPQRFFVGGTAAALCRSAKFPLLVVRHHGFNLIEDETA